MVKVTRRQGWINCTITAIERAISLLPRSKREQEILRGIYEIIFRSKIHGDVSILGRYFRRLASGKGLGLCLISAIFGST